MILAGGVVGHADAGELIQPSSTGLGEALCRFESGIPPDTLKKECKY